LSELGQILFLFFKGTSSQMEKIYGRSDSYMETQKDEDQYAYLVYHYILYS
jgi:hypothetical protein